MKKFRKIITIVAVLSLMNSAFSLIVSADDNVISADTIMNDEKSSDKEPFLHKDLIIETARYALESYDKAENMKLYFELAEGEKIEDYLLPDTECDDTEYNESHRVYMLTADKDTFSKYIDMFENDKDYRIKYMFFIHENPLSPEVRKSNVVAYLRGFLERRYDDFEWLKMTFELAEGEKIEDYLLPDTEYKESNGKYILTASKETYSKYIDIFENDVDNRIVNCDFFAPVMAGNDFEVREYIIGDINSDGKTDLTDLSELSLALVGDKEFTEAQQKAADVDGDGAVKLADLAKFRQYLSKVISSLG